jgi:hypothetical protein
MRSWHGLSGVDRVVQERIINSEQIDGKIVKISLDYVLCLHILRVGFLGLESSLEQMRF